MAKPARTKDVPGYIYAFEIISGSVRLSYTASEARTRHTDPATPNKVSIKVGFSTNMIKRLDQWEKQCPSEPMVLRGSWPSCTPGDDEGGNQYVNGAVSTLRGTIKPGKAVTYPRRIEVGGNRQPDHGISKQTIES
ncbi:hypothetical protein FRC10_001601 [Ceratobasidium sp. 414]|nr:hypothetical protein FRC10_001601 [Ceratobasidium sp. 414]